MEQTAKDIPANGEPAQSQTENANQEPNSALIGKIEQKDPLEEKRRHARFEVYNADVRGKILFLEEVNIVDMSVSGVALEVNRRLKLGRDCVLHFHANKDAITLSAEITRSHLSGWKTDAEGNTVPLYLVGMAFKNVSPKRRKEIAAFIDNHQSDGVKIDTGSILSGTRLYARFHIASADHHCLDLQTRCKVKVLSMGGMLIESEESVSLNKKVQIKLYLPEDRSISSLGRIVSCKEMGIVPERYDIGVEFIEMSEEDGKKLKTFLRDIAKTQAGFEEVKSKSMSEETANHKALNLLEEIKMLLRELREELVKLPLQEHISPDCFQR